MLKHRFEDFSLPFLVSICILADVRKAAEAVVIAWFNFLDQDPILLLRRLDTEGVPKTSKLCLDHLLPNLEEDTLVTVITKWATDYLDEK